MFGIIFMVILTSFMGYLGQNLRHSGTNLYRGNVEVISSFTKIFCISIDSISQYKTQSPPPNTESYISRTLQVVSIQLQIYMNTLVNNSNGFQTCMHKTYYPT